MSVATKQLFCYKVVEQMDMNDKKENSIILTILLGVLCIAVFGIFDFALTCNSIAQYKDSIVIGNYIGFALFVITTIFLMYVFSLMIEKMMIDSIEAEDSQVTEVKREGKIRFLSGEYEGIVLDVDKDGIVIGRDARQCNFILNFCEISRKHCSIQFVEEMKQYIITDYSTFGTFISYEGRLKKGYAKYVQPGCIVWIKMGTSYFEMQLM